MDNTYIVLEMIDEATKQLELEGMPRLSRLKTRQSYMTILQLIKEAVKLAVGTGHTLAFAVNNAYQAAIDADINTGTDNAPIVKAMLEVLYPDVELA